MGECDESSSKIYKHNCIRQVLADFTVSNQIRMISKELLHIITIDVEWEKGWNVSG